MLMEFVGEESRIQALFRELRLEDRQLTPRFSTVWDRAQLNRARSRRVLSLAFGAATVLLASTLFSLIWWSHYRRGGQPNISVANGPGFPSVSPAPAAASPAELKPEAKYASTVPQRRHSGSKPHFVRFAVRQQVELLAEKRSISDAVAVSGFQSPTGALLRSPDDELLTSLPQLESSSNELKSFLNGFK